MKKSILARGFIGSVASLLGVMAVGCGADTGWDEGAAGEGEIGVSEQALTNANVVNQSHNFDNAGADKAVHGSGCEVTDPVSPGTAKFMITLGGIENDAGNAFSDDAVLYRPGVGYDANARVAFTDARAFATVITDPSDPQACLAFGGETDSAVRGQIVKIEVGHNGTNYTLTASNAGTLSTARSRLSAVVIGSKVLLMGGFTSPGEANASNVIDIWNGQTGTTAIPTLKNTSNVAVTLATARGSFAAEKSAQSDRRILLGGGRAAGADLNSIEAILLNASDQLASTATTAEDVTDVSPSSQTTIGTARNGLMLVYGATISADRETWVFGPGSNLNEVKSVNVDWSDFTNANNTAPVNACTSGSILAVTKPLNVKMASNRFVMVGSTGSNKNSVQEFNAGACTNVTTDSGSNALVTREGALGALVGGSVYYTAGRDSSVNPDTYQLTTFKVN